MFDTIRAQRRCARGLRVAGRAGCVWRRRLFDARRASNASALSRPRVHGWPACLSFCCGVLVLLGACSAATGDRPQRAHAPPIPAAGANPDSAGAPADSAAARNTAPHIDNAALGSAPAGQAATQAAMPGAMPAAAGSTAPPPKAPAASAASKPAPAADGGTKWTPQVNRDAYCKGESPAIAVPGANAMCTGKVASQAFRYAVCACNDALVGGTFSTDGFDSSSGMGMSVAGGGAMGVNGAFTCSGVLDVGGSVTVAGPGGWVVNALSSGPIQGDLRIAGPMTQDGMTSVARNAWLGAEVIGSGSLTVAGDLHQTPGAAQTVPVLDVQGERLREAVTIDPPCACDADKVLDIAGIVDLGKADNDNAAAGFDPDSLAHVVVNREVELPCGRLYASELSVDGAATLTVKVSGRVALFVDHDVRTAGMLDLELGPDAELDIFVRGSLVLAGIQSAGGTLKPANLRVYVGGSDGILLAGITSFTGNIYAPHATVTAGGIQDIYGSVFAGDFVAAGVTNVHYDRAVVFKGKDCGPPDQPPPPPRCDDCSEPPPPPPPQCSDCTGCAASQACIDGACGACRTDADCCQPLSCLEGTCSPLLF